MPDPALDLKLSPQSPPVGSNSGARHEHLWLGLMLLALHAASAWEPGVVWRSVFLLTHFALFLKWQPLGRGGGKHEPRQVVLMVLIGILLATAGSNWLLALWLTALTALIGGHVPGTASRRQRTASLLAALYLLCLLLIWVVPLLAAQPPPGTVLTTLVRYGLPLLPAAILLLRPAPPRPAGTVVIDLFYSVMLFLLVAALVLGSLIIVKTTQGPYLVALAQTLMVIAMALLGLSWLMSPRAGFAGLDQMLSRYLLSVGLPFEQWVQRLADLAQRESAPPQFLDAAIAHVQSLPLVTGIHWETPFASGHRGRLDTHHADFALDTLRLAIHTRRPLSPAILLHMRLLAQMVGHFYAAKLREEQQRRNAYTQAIHETGSRLTHDVKNLLQSLQVLCAVAQDNDPALSGELVALVQRQLPQITQRLNTTLDKLRAPELVHTPSARLATWWHALQQRYAQRNVELKLQGTLADTMAPTEMFDSVVENLVENALRKSAGARLLFEAAHMTISVSNSGEAVPKAIAAQLFNAPVPSQAGLGVGLYHAARFAAQHGYTLTLARNEPGAVCFQLQPATEKN